MWSEHTSSLLCLLPLCISHANVNKTKPSLASLSWFLSGVCHVNKRSTQHSTLPYQTVLDPPLRDRVTPQGWLRVCEIRKEFSLQHRTKNLKTLSFHETKTVHFPSQVQLRLPAQPSFLFCGFTGLYIVCIYLHT